MSKGQPGIKELEHNHLVSSNKGKGYATVGIRHHLPQVCGLALDLLSARELGNSSRRLHTHRAGEAHLHLLEPVAHLQHEAGLLPHVLRLRLGPKVIEPALLLLALVLGQ